MSEDYVKHSQDEIDEVCGKAMAAIRHALLNPSEQDTREKLEADIAHDFYLYKKPGLERIFGWLDRQAAITERENDELRKLNHLLRKSEAAPLGVLLRRAVQALQAEGAVRDNAGRVPCSPRDEEAVQMTKTKRQLRAEAVERLRECRYHTLADYVRAMLGWGHEPHFEDSRGALIDLLTDDEIPDGDAVGIMRKAAKGGFVGGTGHVMKNAKVLLDINPVSGCDSVVFETLADMVERDYVRRVAFEAKDAEVEDLRDERDRMQADYERIYQFQVVETERNHWKSNAERYKAERDEWKAKCETREVAYKQADAERKRYSEQIDELTAERDELKAENKLLRERKCPGYNPDRHYCEFRAQDFKLNSKTVRTLKQDRKKLIDILTNIGVEVRDDEFGLSFMYDNYHNLGSENERLEEQLIDACKSRDHWQRVAGKHAAEIKRLKGQLEAERELAGIWPRWEDGAPIKPPCEIVYEGRRERIQGITFYKTSTVFQFTGVDHGKESVGYPHGCTFERPPLVAKDGKPIEVGQTLYGEDGKAWVVEGIDHKNKWSVWVHYENTTDRHKCLKPEWLTHEKPDTFGVCQNGGKVAAAQALQPLLKEPGDIGGTPLLELGA